MIRRTRKPKEQQTQPIRSVEYKGYDICKTEEGAIYVKAGGIIHSFETKADAADFIDNITEEPKETESTEFPRGGHSRNPPETCERRVKFEKSGSWWVENIACAFSCKENVNCPTYKELMAGQKKRLSMLRTGDTE